MVRKKHPINKFLGNTQKNNKTTPILRDSWQDPLPFPNTFGFPILFLILLGSQFFFIFCNFLSKTICAAPISFSFSLP